MNPESTQDHLKSSRFLFWNCKETHTSEMWGEDELETAEREVRVNERPIYIAIVAIMAFVLILGTYLNL